MKPLKSALAVAVLSVIALTGCSGSDANDPNAPIDCTPAEGPVTLSFTSWIPGIDDVVDVWNKENPDIQVKVQTGPNGNSGTYQNFFNQLKAGNAPDLGQVEYDALPNFRVQGGLSNIGSCQGVAAAESAFVPWAWNQVSFGEENSAFGIPQDTGPMAMFYRSDLFEKNNIAVPTTWAEFADAAVEVRKTGSYITNFSQNDVNQFAGLVWQTGDTWFTNDGDKWGVALAGTGSATVAEYWQDLIDRDLVSSYPGWTSEWDNAYNTGKVWSWNSAVWGANSIASGAPTTAGNWRVAPMPQWEQGGNASGNWGGSSTVVFTGSKHPYEATKFALWLNTSTESLTMLNEVANLYPATTAGMDLPVLESGVDFFGGQKIYDVFADSSAHVSSDFIWGPTMSQTYNSISDGFKASVTGKGTLLDALQSAREATIKELTSQSIPVAE